MTQYIDCCVYNVTTCSENVECGQCCYLCSTACAFQDLQFVRMLYPTILRSTLQNDRSQADLIAMLTNVGMKSPHALQQMYALYDGTKRSLSATPDIDVFRKRSAGESVSSRQRFMVVNAQQHCPHTFMTKV